MRTLSTAPPPTPQQNPFVKRAAAYVILILVLFFAAGFFVENKEVQKDEVGLVEAASKKLSDVKELMPTKSPKIMWKTAIEVGVEPASHIKSLLGSREPILSTRSPSSLVMGSNHYIYSQTRYWDGPPIIVPQFKLVFFTIPKAGCTVFKQLFRRINGFQNWEKHTPGGDLPHNPNINGLNYLNQYSPEDAIYMLTSADWTRAMFVRDPKERILSAYLDKGVRRKNGVSYVQNHCCAKLAMCGPIAAESLEGFLQVVHNCWDPHWAPQSQRMEGRYWPYIDYIGHLEHAYDDTKRLLIQLGAWEEYGAWGWGLNGTEAIFASTSGINHETGASGHMSQHYTAEAEAMVEDMYADDYNFLIFKFTNSKIVEQ
jgi:hypothetical protein